MQKRCRHRSHRQQETASVLPAPLLSPREEGLHSLLHQRPPAKPSRYRRFHTPTHPPCTPMRPLRRIVKRTLSIWNPSASRFKLAREQEWLFASIGNCRQAQTTLVTYAASDWRACLTCWRASRKSRPCSADSFSSAATSARFRHAHHTCAAMGSSSILFVPPAVRPTRIPAQ